jgi:hypothetical protein
VSGRWLKGVGAAPDEARFVGRGVGDVIEPEGGQDAVE